MTTMVVILIFSAVAYAITDTYTFTHCGLDNEWTDCNSAKTDDVVYASGSENAANDTGRWLNFGMSNVTNNITNVTIIADNFGSSTDAYMGFQASWDHDLSYGPSKYAGWIVNEQRSYLDITDQTSWTATKLSNPEFRIKVICYTVSGPITCNLEWLAVRVIYS